MANDGTCHSALPRNWQPPTRARPVWPVADNIRQQRQPGLTSRARSFGGTTGEQAPISMLFPDP